MATVNYLDFELKILRQDGRYVVQVLRSPAGEARCEFERSLSDVEVENLLLKLARIRSTTRRIDSPELAPARTLGAELFKAAFRDTVRDCYRSSLAKAQLAQYGLRLKLRLQDVPELAVLPWEFLFDPDASRFLARSVYTPIVRYLELPESVPAFTTTLPLRLLGVVASPDDYDGIDVEREHRLLEQALAPLVQSGQLEIEWLEQPMLSALRRRLRNKQYHILHFIGHGGFDDRTQQGVLVFEDEQARGALVAAETLSVLLHDHHSLRLVVLNACEGARSSMSDPFAGVATTFVQQGIPAVVAMQFVITDTAALAFAEEFYTALADGFPVDTAVAEARKAILTANNEVEWGTPVLFLRTDSGVLFDFQATAPRQRDTAAGAAGGEAKGADAPPSVTRHEDRAVVVERMGADVRSASTFGAPERNETSTTASQSGKVDENRQQQLADLWRSALMSFYARDWAAAIRNFQAVLELDAQYRDAAAKLVKAQQEQKLASLYTSALQARDVGDLNVAASTLQQLVAEDTSYKDAAALLEDVRRTVLLAARYDDARTLAAAGQWRAVLEVLDEIAKLDSEYQDPEQLWAVARTKLAEQLRHNELEDLLSQVLGCLEAEDWPEARVRLVRIQEIEPDYRGAAKLLLRVDQELADLPAKTSATQAQVTVYERKSKDDAITLVTDTGVCILRNNLGAVSSVAFSPNGEIIASGGHDNTVRLRDAEKGTLLLKLEGHTERVNSVVFSPNGKTIASGGDDKTVRLWDAEKGTLLRVFESHTGSDGHTGSVSSVVFSPNSKIIASAGGFRPVSGATATLLLSGVVLGEPGFWIARRLADKLADKTVRLWDAEEGTQVRTLKGHDGAVNSVAFSPDGKVIASGGVDSTVRLWDAEKGTQVRTLKGHDGAVYSVAFSPDGKVIASGGADRTVWLWDTSTGNHLRTLKGHDGAVNSVAFSPDSNLIGSGSDDKTVRLWNAATGTVVGTFEGHDALSTSVAFSPTGKVIASGGADRTVRLWRLKMP